MCWSNFLNFCSFSLAGSEREQRGHEQYDFVWGFPSGVAHQFGVVFIERQQRTPSTQFCIPGLGRESRQRPRTDRKSRSVKNLQVVIFEIFRIGLRWMQMKSSAFSVRSEPLFRGTRSTDSPIDCSLFGNVSRRQQTRRETFWIQIRATGNRETDCIMVAPCNLSVISKVIKLFQVQQPCVRRQRFH